jgi:hypothetical protein
VSEASPGLALRRPRDVGELLRDALLVYRRRFGTFVLLAAAIVIPVELIVSGIGLEQLSAPHDDNVSLTESLIPAVLSLVVTTPLITATCIYALDEAAAGRRPAVGETLTRGLEAFTPVFLAVLIAAVGIALGLALFVVPGIYLAIRWFFVPQAVVIDGRSGIEPLRRSSEVVRGFWWRTFAIVALANIAAVLPGLVVIGPLEALAESADREVVSLVGRAIVEILTAPFLALVATLLWFDLDARRSGGA